MPEVGVRTGARILIDVGDGDGNGSTFPTAGHLAAHAGLAPTTRSRVLDPRRTAVPEEDPSSSNGPSSSPSFAASGDPASRIHHDRKITQGTHRTQALPRRTPDRRPLRRAPRRNLLRTPACHLGPALIGHAAGRTVPFIETVDHDRVTTQDARTHALIDRRPHTRFAQDRQSAGRPPARHPPPRPKTQGHPPDRTEPSSRQPHPPGRRGRPPTGGRATVGPAEGRSRRGAVLPGTVVPGGGRAGERWESTVPGGSGRPRIAA